MKKRIILLLVCLLTLAATASLFTACDMHHEYDTENPMWVWEGYETATASFSCINEDCTHKINIGASITKDTVEPTVSAAGENTYTAHVVLNGVTYSDVKTEAIPMLEPETPPVIPSASEVEIANFDYGFIEEESYEYGETTMADTKRSTEIKVDTVYYCLIEFDIIARDINDGTGLMNILIKFDNLGVANGTVVDVGGGIITEMFFADSGTGTDSKVSTLAYKIPSDPDKSKKIKILVRMLPVSIGSSHISVSFEPKETEAFRVLGDAGVTKNLSVVRVQLEAPVIEVDRDNLKVKWSHVKYADYYIIYFADKSINFTGVDQYTPVGAELEFDLSQFASIVDYYVGTVMIQACSNSSNFMKSSYSNTVTEVII